VGDVWDVAAGPGPRDRVVTTVAGVGRSGSAGDGGPADQAELTDPQSIEVAADGSLYVAERSGNRIRRIDADRTISTVAGTGGAGFSGDGGPAVNAQLTGPYATTTGDGTVYIADDEAHRVRRVDPSGIITTVVGTGERGLPSDGDSVSSAFLATPAGISTTPDGTLLITDIDNNQAYSVKDGVLHVLAGGGRATAAPGVPARQHARHRAAAVPVAARVGLLSARRSPR